MFLIIDRGNYQTYGFNINKIVQIDLDEKIIRIINDSIYYEIWFKNPSTAWNVYMKIMDNIDKNTNCLISAGDGLTDCSCRLSLS